MKRSATALLPILVALHISAQNNVPPTDSVGARELDEVVVEADMQHTSAKVTTYIPGPAQKRLAGDAISLLGMMNISQLSVNPVNGSLKTAAGQPLTVFIDCVEASSEDLTGLDPREGKRVEYYDSPSDPRFIGKRHVVNFIMQHYLWGGYTKIDAAQSLGVTATTAALYSKMKYKAMNFDIYAGEKYDIVRHAGNESTEAMRFTDLYGNGPADITRSISQSAANTDNRTTDLSLRAIYSSGKMQINNRIGLNLSATPECETTNTVNYQGDINGASTARAYNQTDNTTLRYRGQYLFYLPDNMSLNIGAQAKYGRNGVDSRYIGSNGFSTANNAREKSFFATLNPNLNWQISDSHSLTLYGVGMWRDNRIDYSGDSDSRQTYRIDGYMGGATYDFESDNWGAHLNAAWTWQTNTISDYRRQSSYPKIDAELTYSPSANTQLLASYGYYESFPEASATSPVRLRQDELLSYTGNPALRNSPTHEIALQSMWLPSNKWQLTLTAFHYRISHRRVSEYSPDGPDGTMLRYYTNNGNYQNTMIGLNATSRLFGGKLVTRANPQLWLRETTGAFAMTRNELTCTAQLTYYFGRFYAMGWYMTPSHYPAENSGIETRSACQYQIRAGWGACGWNVNISASNFLRSNWRSTHESLHSRSYDMSRNIYTPGAHRQITITATYTFGYGKKLEHNNELSSEASSASAILK